MARKQSHSEPTENAAPEAAAEPVESTEATPEQSTALERTAEPAASFTEAVHEGIEDARSAAAGFLPAVGKFVHKGVYSGFYYLTYGIVFGSLVIGKLVPANSAVAEGVRDGAKAAKEAFEAQSEARHGAHGSTPDEGLAPT